MSYEQIFDQQGVPGEFRGPDDYFFVRLTENDSLNHAGEVYAIPRQVYLRGNTFGLYDHQENGALIEERATVDDDVTIGSRSIVHNASLGKGVEIGARSIVGSGVHLSATKVGDEVEIAGGALINMADIGDESTIGKVRITGFVERSIIGRWVTLEDNVLLAGHNRIDSGTKVRKGAVLEEGVELGRQVEIGAGAVLHQWSEVRDESYVMPDQRVKANRVVRKNTVVYPKEFKHARKSN